MYFCLDFTFLNYSLNFKAFKHSEGTTEVIFRLNPKTGLEQKGNYRDNTWLLFAQIQIKKVVSSITEYDLSFLVSPCKFD